MSEIRSFDLVQEEPAASRRTSATLDHSSSAGLEIHSRRWAQGLDATTASADFATGIGEG